MDNKFELRKKYKFLRDGFSQSYLHDVSNKIVNNIFLWEKYKEAKNIMLFYPIKSEISLLPLLEDETKLFYFPVVEGDNLFPVRYESEKGFKKGEFQINEPVGSLIDDFSSIDIVLTPALAVDKNGYRLGYGRGFYDRFFEHFSSQVIKAVPVCSKLFVENIPFDERDKKVDFVITEENICPTIHSILNN